MKAAFIKSLLLASISAALLNACTVMNVNLGPGQGRLEETVIEGKGPEKVVLIDISGIISDAKRGGLLSPSEPAMPDRVRQELMRASEDKRVKAVLIRINSPGGAVSATDLIHHELVSFKKKTGVPVYASIVGVGASGGLYVAMAADRIFAQPASITGSIGIIAFAFDAEGLMQKLGIRDKSYKSAPLKGSPSLFRQDTEQERAIMQGLMDGMHERFVNVVVEGRKGVLTRDQVVALSDGRPLSERQAHVAGLIDEVGYPADAFEALRKTLKLPEAALVAYGRPGEYRGSIYSLQNVQNNAVISLDASELGIGSGPRFMYLWTGE